MFDGLMVDGLWFTACELLTFLYTYRPQQRYERCADKSLPLNTEP